MNDDPRSKRVRVRLECIKGITFYGWGANEARWPIKERNARRFDRFDRFVSSTHECLAAGAMAAVVAVVAPARKRVRLASIASPRKEINVKTSVTALDKTLLAPPM